MSEKWIKGPYVFEPHNGFPGLDPIGEPWPFGYISEIAPNDIPSPVFELDLIIERPFEELYATAALLAAAPAMAEAISEAADLIQSLFGPVSHEDEAGWSDSDARDVFKRLIATLAVARGEP